MKTSSITGRISITSRALKYDPYRPRLTASHAGLITAGFRDAVMLWEQELCFWIAGQVRLRTFSILQPEFERDGFYFTSD